MSAFAAVAEILAHLFEINEIMKKTHDDESANKRRGDDHKLHLQRDLLKQWHDLKSNS